MRKRLAFLALTILAVVVLWVLLSPPAGPIDSAAYDRTNVTAYDANGSELATVDVRIADTRDKRYVGLSHTESLATDEGMLFVHPEEEESAYVMRNMSFPLDIIFVDREGRVTEIHHAHVPETGDGPRYRGTGKYVLEVNRGWANETGLDIGDTIDVPAGIEAES